MSMLKNIIKTLANLPRTLREKPVGTRYIFVPTRKGGVVVNHDTALQFATVFACVQVISESIAALPWYVLRASADGKTRERQMGNPVETVLHRRPNTEMTPFEFRQLITTWALLAGNGYAEIARDRSNRVSELWPIHPERMNMERMRETNELRYEVSNNAGANTILLPENVFHLRGMSMDGMLGLSVVALAQRTIGTGIASDEFGASFYGNNMQGGTVIEHPGKLGDKALEHIRDSIERGRKGPSNAFKPVILEEGMQWKSTAMPAKDAQFIESNNFRVEEICRWFRVPPHKVQHLLRATFSNIEHQSIDFVTDTLVPWITRLEQVANQKLFGSNASPLMYTKMMVNALLRGDSQSRANYFKEMSQLGVYSINEVRELEDLNPIPEGDERIVPMNMTTLEKLMEPDPEPVVSAPPAPGQEEDLGEFENILLRMQLKAAKREYHRLVSAILRYGERNEFLSFLDAFYQEHANYLRARLGPVFEGFGDRHEVPSDVVRNLFEDYASWVVGNARLMALGAFDKKSSDVIEPNQLAEARTKMATVMLLEVIKET